MTCVSWLLLGAVALGARATVPREAVQHFEQGVTYYEQEDYAAAVSAFEHAVEGAPEQSEYHRRLGRAYGRLAQQVSWLEAIGLVRKTHRQLEKAVALDTGNLEALSDLIDFYEHAPGFLGGSKADARLLRQRLQDACEDPATQDPVCEEYDAPDPPSE